ncbi:hypothetical protein O5629_27530, partial [Escherichia coli]|nr:hypothetical protein [Escherichia coli]
PGGAAHRPVFVWPTREQRRKYLSLNDGRIRFRSTLTYHGMLYRMCSLVVISGITGGLAYPLLNIWMIDWQAKNTYLLGDLDDLP